MNECNTKLTLTEERARKAEGLLAERDAELADCRRRLKAAERHVALCTAPAIELVSSLCRTAIDMGVAPLHPAVPKLLSLLPPPSSSVQTNTKQSSADSPTGPAAVRLTGKQNLTKSLAFPVPTAKQRVSIEPSAGGPVRLIDLVANTQHTN